MDRKRFIEVDQSSIYKMNIYLYLHREEEYGPVEGKGIVTIFTLIRSNRKKGVVRIGTYLENSYTTVSWKLRNIF